MPKTETFSVTVDAETKKRIQRIRQSYPTRGDTRNQLRGGTEGQVVRDAISFYLDHADTCEALSQLEEPQQGVVAALIELLGWNRDAKTLEFLKLCVDCGGGKAEIERLAPFIDSDDILDLIEIDLLLRHTEAGENLRPILRALVVSFKSMIEHFR